MTKFTILPKFVKALEIVYSRYAYNGWRSMSAAGHKKRLIIGKLTETNKPKYYVAEHSKTRGLEKGDAFIIKTINQD